MKRYTEEEKKLYVKLVDELGYSKVNKRYGINKATLLMWKNPQYKQKCRNNTSKWLEKNPKYLKKWNEKNAGYSTIKTREWVSKNPEKNRLMHIDSFNRLKADSKRYKATINKNTKYSLNRYRTNIKYKTLHCLRSRLTIALRKAVKTESTLELLGCDMDFFMEYIKNKFQGGMSWDNYGEWEVDHIKPCSAYNMLNESDRKECFHYTNLQPLWKEDNRRKGSKA